MGEERMQQKALGVHLPEEGQALPSHALERGQVHGLQEEDLHPRGGPVLVDRRQEEGLVLVASRHMMYEVGKGKGSQETTYAFQVFCFDHAIAHADRLGSQKLTIVLDLEGLGWRNLDLNCLKNIVLLAQARYPERLGACLFYRPPNVFYGLWKAVKPLVDPRTAGKIRFAFNAEELQEELGPPAQVPVLLGGDMPDGEMLPVESIPL